MLSPLEEAEEWAKIQDIMASIGSGVVRESVFMAELEHEFQQRLGLYYNNNNKPKPLPYGVPQTLTSYKNSRYTLIPKI